MSVISTRTKGKAGIKVARAGAKRLQAALSATKIALPVGKTGLKASKPLLRRRTRQRVEQLDRASRTLGEALAVHAPRVVS
jgi:hypothetical protein